MFDSTRLIERCAHHQTRKLIHEKVDRSWFEMRSGINLILHGKFVLNLTPLSSDSASLEADQIKLVHLKLSHYIMEIQLWNRSSWAYWLIDWLIDWISDWSIDTLKHSRKKKQFEEMITIIPDGAPLNWQHILWPINQMCFYVFWWVLLNCVLLLLLLFVKLSNLIRFMRMPKRIAQVCLGRVRLRDDSRRDSLEDLLGGCE